MGISNTVEAAANWVSETAEAAGEWISESGKEAEHKGEEEKHKAERKSKQENATFPSFAFSCLLFLSALCFSSSPLCSASFPDSEIHSPAASAVSETQFAAASH